MKNRLHPCIGLALLLVACDKQQGTGHSTSANESKPKVARVNRPPRQSARSSLQELRESLNVAMKIESPEARDQALAKVARDALELAPELSSEAIGRLSANSVEKAGLLQDCATCLAAQSPDDALAWAASLGSAKDLAAAKAEIALVLVDSDPQRAVKLIAASDLADGESNGAAAQVLRRWTSNAPADAAAWVLKFPPGDSRKAGVKAVASQWIIADSQAASSWMGTLRNDPIRKEATRAMAEALVGQPSPIRDALLESAVPDLRSELIQQAGQVAQEEQQAAQKEEQAAQQLEQVTPKVEEPTPKVEQVTPKVEEPTPQVEQVTPMEEEEEETTPMEEEEGEEPPPSEE